MHQTKLFSITDMNCGSCVLHIEKDVSKMKGVHHIAVNFAAAKAQVMFDPEVVSAEEIVAQIKKAGYTAALIDDSKNMEGHEMNNSDGMEGHDHAAMEDANSVKNKLYKVIFGTVVSVVLILMSLFLVIPNEGVIMFVLTLFVLVYTGREFFIRGIPALLLKARPNMDTLVAFGTGAAFLYSSYNVLFANVMEEYFMDASIIATFVMFGRYLEARAKGSANEAVKKLFKLSAKVAHVVDKNGKTSDVAIELVKKGYLLMVKPGEKIPVDGVIVDGEAVIDESMVTGESIPSNKEKGDTVIGATINSNTSFTMRAEKVGDETMLSQMIKLVEQAQMHKAPIQKLVDVVSNYFVWAVILIAIFTVLIWTLYFGVSLSKAMIYAVAVLIIACPCALGLATPISIVVGTGKGASLGILIKKPESLEKMHKITTVCFDKTGTITAGHPIVTEFIEYKMPEGAGENFSTNDLLMYAASLEHASEHPLGKSVVDYAEDKNVKLLEVKGMKAVIGKGVFGSVDGHEVLVGSQKFLETKGIIRYSELDVDADRLRASGNTVLFLAIDGRERGIFAVKDTERETSLEAVKILHDRGIKTVMMTGDNLIVAQAIAKKVGIDQVFAGVSPADKADKIKKLIASGEFVAMIGDGINDAPALATANVGIAVGTGTDVAMESGDIVLVKGDLLKAIQAIDLSKATLRNIKQNLFWAFIYNSVGVPLAALGLLNPIVSALAMAFSSVSVVLNALRLKRFK